MQGRIGLLLAGAALAIGGGVAGAVVVAPTLVDQNATVAEFSQAGKQNRATPQHTWQVAKKARGMARGARQLADGLVEQVNGVEAAANEALGTANQALNAAGAANTRIDATKIALGTASGRVQTDSTTDYVPLAGGPSVTVTVPDSGYIEVWASATLGEEGDTSVDADGAIALYEDGQQVPMNQDGLCAGGAPLDDALIAGQGPEDFEMTLSTPPVPILGLGCGSAGATPGSLVFKRPPGTHTYELRYGDTTCSCSTVPSAFSNRVLQIAPRL